MKKKILWTSTLVLTALVLTSCGAKYKNGNYTGEYVDEKRKQRVEVAFNVEDNKIKTFSFVEFDSDGNPKGEDYGKEAGESNYQIAQNALKESQKYPELIVKAGDIDQVDALSGATSTLMKIKEAVKDALKKGAQN